MLAARFQEFALVTCHIILGETERFHCGLALQQWIFFFYVLCFHLKKGRKPIMRQKFEKYEIMKGKMALNVKNKNNIKKATVYWQLLFDLRFNF